MRSFPSSSSFYRPGQVGVVESRLARFEKLNAFVRSRNGFVTSVPGASMVTIEVLPGSGLPDELRGLGYYDLELIGEKERILPAAIVEHFTRRADGELEPFTPGSTKPVAETRTHAGIVRVERYAFAL